MKLIDRTNHNCDNEEERKNPFMTTRLYVRKLLVKYLIKNGNDS